MVSPSMSCRFSRLISIPQQNHRKIQITMNPIPVQKHICSSCRKHDSPCRKHSMSYAKAEMVKVWNSPAGIYKEVYSINPKNDKESGKKVNCSPGKERPISQGRGPWNFAFGGPQMWLVGWSVVLQSCLWRCSNRAPQENSNDFRRYGLRTEGSVNWDLNPMLMMESDWSNCLTEEKCWEIQWVVLSSQSPSKGCTKAPGCVGALMHCARSKLSEKFTP